MEKQCLLQYAFKSTNLDIKMATVIKEKDNFFKEINILEPSKIIIDWSKVPFLPIGITKKRLEEYLSLFKLSSK